MDTPFTGPGSTCFSLLFCLQQFPFQSLNSRGSFCSCSGIIVVADPEPHYSGGGGGGGGDFTFGGKTIVCTCISNTKMNRAHLLLFGEGGDFTFGEKLQCIHVYLTQR